MEKKPKRLENSDGKESLKGVTTESLGTAPLMMTADEIATCLNISSRTVWRLKAKGDLPKSLKIGRAVRWRKRDILQWIEEGCPASNSLINQFPFFHRPDKAFTDSIQADGPSSCKEASSSSTGHLKKQLPRVVSNHG